MRPEPDKSSWPPALLQFGRVVLVIFTWGGVRYLGSHLPLDWEFLSYYLVLAILLILLVAELIKKLGTRTPDATIPRQGPPGPPRSLTAADWKPAKRPVPRYPSNTLTIPTKRTSSNPPPPPRSGAPRPQNNNSAKAPPCPWVTKPCPIPGHPLEQSPKCKDTRPAPNDDSVEGPTTQQPHPPLAGETTQR